MRDLAGRTAVVTGGGSGFGAAMARALGKAGMRLVIADFDLPAAEGIAAELSSGAVKALAIEVDVGAPASLKALARRTADELGGCALLCANVGVQQIGALERLTAADWEWLLRVNVLGTVETVNAFLPQLVAQRGGGHILLTASTSGLIALPCLGAYTATKYAIVGYGETLRLELAARGIGVTVVMPGPMMTSHLASSARSRPAGLGPSVTSEDDLVAVSQASLGSTEDVVDADYAARHVLDAVRNNDPYLVTHPPQRGQVEQRFTEILAAFDRADS
ncbi:MAG TPA: SDR family NAD(P)-dependent oxidoreductase [Candidatus Bathyarchaeia archaeon]|nr:SDR family NAD(P)-dependent oxidoreductase [Candidatus Bathyarchaeia archaeon]